MRAFLLDGTQGIILEAGVWHALSRFTVRRGAEPAFMLLTDQDTQLEIEGKLVSAGAGEVSDEEEDAWGGEGDVSAPEGSSAPPRNQAIAGHAMSGLGECQ